MKKWLTALIIIATLGMVLWGVSEPWRERNQWDDLVERTSDAIPTTRTITVLGDDWLGYLVIRSGDFQNRMARAGIRVRFEVEPDFEKRIRALRDGTAEFIVLTLDSYLVSGAASDWPGSAIFVIDESFGGDAVIGDADLTNIDTLNQPEVRGAFVGDSPSEFLLKSQTSHFQLDALRPRLAGMRVPTAEAASQAFAKGEVDFAVLWEPFVSQTLAGVDGAHILVDTKQARGLIVDLCLASRRVLADDPDLAETFTLTYFATLHDLLNQPDKLRAVAAKDSGKSPEEADLMLAGIRFTSLDENATDWLSSTSAPTLVESIESIGSILADGGQRVTIPRNDPLSLLYRGTIADVATDRQAIAPLIVAQPAATASYPALSDAEWEQITSKVKGTLLDEPITFRPGSIQIPDDFQDAVRRAAPKLAHYPDYRVVVEAHVSPSDDPDADRALSEQRADAVKQFLRWECAIPGERIHTVGVGGTNPPERISGQSQRAWERRARRARITLVGE